MTDELVGCMVWYVSPTANALRASMICRCRSSTGDNFHPSHRDGDGLSAHALQPLERGAVEARRHDDAAVAGAHGRVRQHVHARWRQQRNDALRSVPRACPSLWRLGPLHSVSACLHFACACNGNS